MLILIAHGSKDHNWRNSVEKVVESLNSDTNARNTRLAYMECASPTLAETVSEAVREGATSIHVLPLFLAEEGHVERNIRPMVDNLREVHQPVKIELLPPVGQHPLFRELLKKIAAETSS